MESEHSDILTGNVQPAGDRRGHTVEDTSALHYKTNILVNKQSFEQHRNHAGGKITL